MYQKLILIGRLGNAPELRYTPAGVPVTNFSVATNNKWTDKDGEAHEETTWFRVTVWKRQAETCNQYLVKGQQVFVEGRLRPDPETGGPRVWKRQDGTPGASFEVTALNVRFLAKPGAGVSGEISNAVSYGEPPPDLAEDEIPF